MSRRTAFTLTELLVAVGIIVIVAALLVAVVAGRSSNQKVSDATELMQAKILISRTKAFSEQTPRGVRLLPGNVQDGFMHRLVYIEQAPTLPLQGDVGGNATVTFSQSNVYTVWLDKLEVTGGFSSSDQWRVQAGDAFGFTQAGSQYGPYPIISTPMPDQSRGGWDISIYVDTRYQQVPPLNVPTANFTITRANRQLPGEDPIDLPDGMGIDVIDTLPVQPQGSPAPTAQLCSQIQADRYYFSVKAMDTLQVLLPAGDFQSLLQIAGASFDTQTLLDPQNGVLMLLGITDPAEIGIIRQYTGLYDILFSPDGSVLSSAPNGSVTAYPNGKIILWVCDTTGAQSQATNPLATPSPGAVVNGAYVGNVNYKANARLICIYTRTGFIAGQSIDRTQDTYGNYYNPFRFTQDGQPGGL